VSPVRSALLPGCRYAGSGGHEQVLGGRYRLSSRASILFVHRLETFGDRLRAFARPWELVAFIWVPGLGLAYACWYSLRTHKTLQDFGVFRAAASAVIHGRSPYHEPSFAALSHLATLPFVYPPAAALPFAPFAPFPSAVAGGLMFFVGLAALVVALRLFGVQDWRCYGVALASAPAVNTLALGTLTSFLLLGAGLAWRHRGNAVVAAVATACAAVLKLFLWPLAIWLLATRRWRAAVLSAVTGVVLLLGGWAIIGFAGLADYPSLVRLVERAEGPLSYSVVALLGLSGTASTAATVMLSLAAIAAIWIAARGRDGDRRAFVVAVLASLLATPLVWLHYFLLLFVPIALYRPRLSRIWFVPLLLWITPATHSDGATWRIAVALGVVAIVTAWGAFEGMRPDRRLSKWLASPIRRGADPSPTAS
jgi:alpha-1,2-mannosyltransferase